MFYLVMIVLVCLSIGVLVGWGFSLYYNNRWAEFISGAGMIVCSLLIGYCALPDSGLRQEVQKVLSKPNAPIKGVDYELSNGKLTIKTPPEGCEIVGSINGSKKEVLGAGTYQIDADKTAKIWFQKTTDPPTSTLVEIPSEVAPPPPAKGATVTN